MISEEKINTMLTFKPQVLLILSILLTVNNRISAQTFSTFVSTDITVNIAYLTSTEVPIHEDFQTLNSPDEIPLMFIQNGSDTCKHVMGAIANQNITLSPIE